MRLRNVLIASILASGLVGRAGAEDLEPIPAPSEPPAAAPAAVTPFSFLVYGDSRSNDVCNGNAIHIGLVNRMAAEPASLAFHTGDMVTGYSNTTNWVQNGACAGPTNYGSFLNQTAPLRNRTPAPGLPMFLYPVVGNHDDAWGDNWYPDPYGSGFCSVFNPQLFVPNHTTKPYFHPNNGNSPVLTDAEFYASACSVSVKNVYPTYMYYSFDFQGTHFLVLRLNNDYMDLQACNSCGGNLTNYEDYYHIHQLDFVKYDLAAARANPATKNIFVMLHSPLFTSCDDHHANESWPLLSQEFTKYKVTAVFSGHAHVYERSVPIVVDAAHPTGVQDNALGTVYMVTGGGGSPLASFNPPEWFDAARESVHHYLRVTVNGSATTIEAVDSNGIVFDSVSRAVGSCTTSAECNDGNLCNGTETCVAGSCQAGAALTCNDNSACTTDACAPATGCSYTPITCNDNSACTTDTCIPATGCSYTPVSCNDSNACTTDSCAPATGCSFVPLTCSDTNACTADSCAPATGCAYAPITCNDNSICTTDSCVPATGCSYTPISCNDQDACTIDSCAPASGCAHTPLLCNDGNSCTTDSCAPASGCAYAPVSCDDGNACTADACSALSGCTHSAASCDDGNACTVDSCAPGTGCAHAAVSCDDGIACTFDACDPSGTCTHSASCNDGNPCTTDSCGATGCVFVNNSNPCNDGNACTAGDVCLAGSCGGGALVVCNDGDACTSDACSPATGCAYAPLSCNDGNACTNDSCLPGSGCQFQNNSAPCDDGNACTAGDSCVGGACAAGIAPLEAPSLLSSCFDGIDNDCDGVVDLDCAVNAAVDGQLVVGGSVTSGALSSLAAASQNQSYETIVESAASPKVVTVVWTFPTVGLPLGTLWELRVDGFRSPGGNDTFPFSFAALNTVATCTTGQDWGSAAVTVTKTADDDQVQSVSLGTVSSTYCVRAKDSKTGSDNKADTLSLDRVFVFPSPVAVSDYPTAADKGTVVAATTFKATHGSDNVYQGLKEANVGGVSRLVQTWKFTNVAPGTSHRLHVEGNRTQTSADKDNFQFYWSTTDPAASTSETGGFTQVNNAAIKSVNDVAGGSAFTFGSTALSGTVYIRVIDTQTASGTVLDTLNLDHLSIKTVP